MFPYSAIPWFYSGYSTRACPCEGGSRILRLILRACSREEYRKLWLTGMSSGIFRIAAHASFASGYMIMRQSAEFMPVLCPPFRCNFVGFCAARVMKNSSWWDR